MPPAAADDRRLEGADLARFQRLLKDYGYGLEVTGEHDEATRKVTDAFQRHFRPALVNGIPDRLGAAHGGAAGGLIALA